MSLFPMAHLANSFSLHSPKKGRQNFELFPEFPGLPRWPRRASSVLKYGKNIPVCQNMASVPQFYSLSTDATQKKKSWCNDYEF